MKRAFSKTKPELMDLPQPVTPELRRDLANLVSLNRHFGSHRLICKFLASWFQPGLAYRVLDLATGAGDIPRLIVRWCDKKGISVRIDAVDANAATIEIARSASADYRNIEWVHADAVSFEPGYTYDLVCCSLALHHFSESEAVELLKRCRQLSDHYILVADLERSWAALLGIWLITALWYRDAMTAHDARLSVRRAFSWNELQEMAEEAGWEEFGHARFLFYRQAIWMSKRDPGLIPPTPVAVADAMPCPT